MSIEENKKTCLRLIDALNFGDKATLDSLLADDVEWWVQGTWAGAGKVDKADLLGAIDGLFSLFVNGITLKVIGITAEGDRVAVEAVSHAPLIGGGSYDNTYHFLYRVRDGKIISGKEYLDTMEVNRVLGPLLAAGGN